MKISKVVSLLCLLACVFLPTIGAADTSKGDFRVAYVNMNQAINQSKAGQRSKKILEAQAKQTKTQLELKQQEIEQKQEELKTSMMLSNQAKSQKETELKRLQIDYKKEVRKAQREFQLAERRHTATIFKDMKSVISGIAKRKAYDLVLEYNINQAILYTKSAVDDITVLAIKEYDAIQSLPDSSSKKKTKKKK